ncbi:CRISPR-associated endoribonuclease Cas6 [Fusobacterium sp. HC1336]|uniref:CRISPR-associated endoribonuclease Cas6 n=1 Tax=Fusobacterium sp. HC1336 TaxID=3171169 RepID=UPI003F298D7F
MRIELNFLLTSNTIPADYRRGFLSFFKMSFEKYDKKIFDLIYNIGAKKDFTFAPFFHLDSFHNQTFYLNKKNLKVLMSIEDDLLGLHFYKAFENVISQEHHFFSNTISLKKVQQIEEKVINSNSVIFKILSPIIIREKLNEEKSWYHTLDSKGIEVLKENLIHSLNEKFDKKTIQALQIEPINIKKTVVTFYKIKMNATLGTIKITGDKKLLEYLYKSGLSSSKKSAGFGMLDILS